MKTESIDSTARARRPAYPLPAIVLLLLAGIAVALIAQHARNDSGPTTAERGSGIAATETRQLPSFAGVELAGANNVHISVGGKQAVVVHADDNLLDRVVTTVSDGVLVIGSRGSVHTTSPMSVDVTLPALDTLKLTGTGTVDADGIRADELTVRVPGTGTVTASGAVERLNASLDGTAAVGLDDLVARHVTATVGGTGELHVRATDSLEATLTGKGAIFYAGHPRHVSQSVTGSGTIAAG